MTLNNFVIAVSDVHSAFLELISDDHALSIRWDRHQGVSIRKWITTSYAHRVKLCVVVNEFRDVFQIRIHETIAVQNLAQNPNRVISHYKKVHVSSL